MVYFLYVVEIFLTCLKKEGQSRCSESSSTPTPLTIDLGFSHDVGRVLRLLYAEFGTAFPTARKRKWASTARTRRNRGLSLALMMLEGVPRMPSEAGADCSNGLAFMTRRSRCLFGVVFWALLTSYLTTWAASTAKFLVDKQLYYNGCFLKNVPENGLT